MAHAKKQRRKENREPVCVMLGAEHLFSQLPFTSQWEEKRPGDEVGEYAQFAVRQSLKFNAHDVVARGAVGFAVGG